LTLQRSYPFLPERYIFPWYRVLLRLHHRSPYYPSNSVFPPAPDSQKYSPTLLPLTLACRVGQMSPLPHFSGTFSFSPFPPALLCKITAISNALDGLKSHSPPPFFDTSKISLRPSLAPQRANTQKAVLRRWLPFFVGSPRRNLFFVVSSRAVQVTSLSFLPPTSENRERPYLT